MSSLASLSHWHGTALFSTPSGFAAHSGGDGVPGDDEGTHWVQQGVLEFADISGPMMIQATPTSATRGRLRKRKIKHAKATTQHPRHQPPFDGPLPA
jgi:hypothetical protein